MAFTYEGGSDEARSERAADARLLGDDPRLSARVPPLPCLGNARSRSPGELTASEGRELVRSLAEFGRPYPVLVLTGGDVLMREDTLELAGYASSLKIPVALAPSVTPKLTPGAVLRMREAGVKAVSISLDGATATTHERHPRYRRSFRTNASTRSECCGSTASSSR